MDWSYYSSGPAGGDELAFWSGPRPDIRTLVQSRNVHGLFNALSYDDYSVRTTAAEGLARIGATNACHIFRTYLTAPSASRKRGTPSAEPAGGSGPGPEGMGGFFDSPPDMPVPERAVKPGAASFKASPSENGAFGTREAEPEGIGGFFDSPPDMPAGETEKSAGPAPDPRKKRKDDDEDPSGLRALFG
jgi:hypothetical protein